MSIYSTYRSITSYLDERTSIAPLVIFRICFGLLMLFSTVRYMVKGWVETQLIDPLLHFHYYGFEWVQPLPGYGMYAVFALMIVSSLGIVLGGFYRLSAAVFFVCFSYVELIDISFYLNHYYFVSIVSFWMIFVPANRHFSLDVARKRVKESTEVSRWSILIFQIQIGIVYVYAGLAKINTDWLVHALPLSIWLPAKTSIPVIGFIFNFKITAFAFSWLGMLFDTLIIAGLIWKKTRWAAYLMVFCFHTITGILFQIGIFPLVMIFAVTIFFSASFHQRIIGFLSGIVGYSSLSSSSLKSNVTRWTISSVKQYLFYPFLMIFILFQVVFPWRYLLYPGNLFWTEEGYRFSWRVMLMEKAGTATFFVIDDLGKEGAVINSQFLSDHQEKQMAMQPDLILQFAHFLEKYFKEQGMKDPAVRVEAWVTYNARPAELLIDPDVDLTKIEDGWKPKSWILKPTWGAEQ